MIDGVTVLAVRVKAEHNGCGCPACQLYRVLCEAGRDVDGEAFADAHAFCTSPVLKAGEAHEHDRGAYERATAAQRDTGD